MPSHSLFTASRGFYLIFLRVLRKSRCVGIAQSRRWVLRSPFPRAPNGPLPHPIPPGTGSPRYAPFPVMLPGGYKMSFHLELQKSPAHKKTVITKAEPHCGGKKNEGKKKGLVSSEYPPQTLLMSLKGLLNPTRERNAQNVLLKRQPGCRRCWVWREVHCPRARAGQS